MKAYKFRSADQIDYALDIVLNDRLFCSDWHHLNDPLEGIFTAVGSFDDKEIAKLFQRVAEEKYALRVCSLTKTYNKHLLWAHYATGFKGLAIEINLPDDQAEILHVNYRDVTELEHVLSPDQKPATIARGILSSKYSEWYYEEEVRLLRRSEWYALDPPVSVTHIICGHRMSSALFKCLKIIADAKEIPISQTKIKDSGIELVRCK